MALAMLAMMVLMGAPDHERHPVRGGLYDAAGCERLEGWKVLPPFEEVSGDELGGTPGPGASGFSGASMEFECALALYLDSPDATDAQKFEHLAKQALRGEKWAAALSRPMARLDFAKYQEFVLKHAKALQPAAWYAVCHVQRPYSPQILRLFYEQALRSPSAEVRRCMSWWFSNSNITEAQARSFASRLSMEEAPAVRAEILSLQLWLHNSRANKLVRDFLGGPLEFEVLDELCGSSSTFVAAKRYDFLPDLKALRARLPEVIASERDVRRKHQVKKDAEEAMGDLDILIAALEKKKAEDEEDARVNGDAGFPAKKARGSTK